MKVWKYLIKRRNEYHSWAVSNMWYPSMEMARADLEEKGFEVVERVHQSAVHGSVAIWSLFEEGLSLAKPGWISKWKKRGLL